MNKTTILIAVAFAYVAFSACERKDVGETTPDSIESPDSARTSDVTFLPEGEPLPEMPWTDDRYAYKTMSDTEAFAALGKLGGLRLTGEEATVLHATSYPGDCYELGFRLPPERARGILDEIDRAFQERVAVSGSFYENWIISRRSLPFGDPARHASEPTTRDGLKFDKWNYITLEHRGATDPDPPLLSRRYYIVALNDIENGNFYLAQVDWQD